MLIVQHITLKITDLLTLKYMCWYTFFRGHKDRSQQAFNHGQFFFIAFHAVFCTLCICDLFFTGSKNIPLQTKKIVNGKYNVYNLSLCFPEKTCAASSRNKHPR